jgi:benzoylformate decarboxylase
MLSLAALTELIGRATPKTTRATETVAHRMAPHPPAVAPSGAHPLTASQVFRTLHSVSPANTVLIEESPSNLSDLHAAWPITAPDTFYTLASGILGWGLPASVGIALAERDSGRNRPVLAVIGDGAFHYSVQSLWTAAQLHLPLLIVVLRNGEYCILKSFAALEDTPRVPGLDIPDFDVVSIAKGYGCEGARLDDLDAIGKAAVIARGRSKPTVLEIPISAQVPPLL